jgi:hypothetical protein
MQLEELRPSPMFICALVLVSYFFVTAGIAYDIINEPPAVGGQTDPVTGESWSVQVCAPSDVVSYCNTRPVRACRGCQAHDIHAVSSERTVHLGGAERRVLLHSRR